MEVGEPKVLRITAYREGNWRSVPFADFEKRFLAICEAHRAQGRALAFAFILFDRSHPYVRSALAQRDYWEALDRRSGRYLSVFSIDVRPPGLDDHIEQRWMHPVKAPSFERATEALNDYFSGLDHLTLPCVLFFQVEKGQVIGRMAVTLHEGGLSETYNELESVIGAAADAVARVRDENAQNAIEIFNLIASALRERQRFQGMLKIYTAGRPIMEIAGFLELLRRILG